MIVREPTENDVSSIRNIYSQYYVDSLGVEEKENIDYFTRKVEDCIVENKKSLQHEIYYLVAVDENNTVVGIGGIRKPSSPLLPFVTTDKPVELNTLFVVEKGKTTGKQILQKLITYCKKVGYKEMVVHSADRFKTSWPFYDVLGMKRVGNLSDDNGDVGQVWLLLI